MQDKMYNNAADFARALNSVAFQFENRAEQIFKKGILDLYRTICIRTPIDTGMARSNWFVAMALDTSKTHQIDSETSDPVSAASQVMSRRMSEFSGEWGGFKRTGEGFDFTMADGAVFIYNNLPYIEALEDGHSPQSPPEGMVTLSLEEFANHLSSMGG